MAARDAIPYRYQTVGIDRPFRSFKVRSASSEVAGFSRFDGSSFGSWKTVTPPGPCRRDRSGVGPRGALGSAVLCPAAPRGGVGVYHRVAIRHTGAMPRTKTRDLYPMPVHGLFNHPDYVNLPTAGRGMLLSICEHYWRGGCRWIPKDDDQLFAVARAHRPTWRHWKPQIIGIFDTIRPELDAYHRKRTGNRNGLIAAAHSANSRRHLKAIEESTARAQGISLRLPAAGMSPRKEANAATRPPRRINGPPAQNFRPVLSFETHMTLSARSEAQTP